MKLYNVKNVKGFFAAVNNCEGRVDMVLPSGNINLNHADDISEVITQVMPAEGIREIEIKTEKKEDLYRLLHFAIRDDEARAIRAELRADAGRVRLAG